MKTPRPKARTMAMAMSRMLTLATFSRKLDLKISLNVMIRFLSLFSYRFVTGPQS
jgi:hypothetical protein